MPLRPVLALLLLAAPAQAEDLKGKTYIVEFSSAQSSSGLGEFLLPQVVRALDRAGMRPASGPGADVVVNFRIDSDVGRWVGTDSDRAWVHTLSAMVGISPEAYVIPPDGTPVFGIRAVLETPDPDREDEWVCLIALAARTAVANWQPDGVFRTDGQSCLRG